MISGPRATLSMAAHGALPQAFTRIHPVPRTPAFGTVFFGARGRRLLAVLATVSGDFLGDAILSIGLLIAFYYGVTGLACVWYFRDRLRLVRDLFLKGILPRSGGLIMLAAFARSVHDMLAPTYGATSFDGVGGVFLLGVGAIVVGVAVMLIVRTRFPHFFRDGRDRRHRPDRHRPDRHRGLIMRTLTIAAVQTTPVAFDVDASWARFASQVRAARDTFPHVELVVVPELMLAAEAPLLQARAGLDGPGRRADPGPDHRPDLRAGEGDRPVARARQRLRARRRRERLQHRDRGVPARRDRRDATARSSRGSPTSRPPPAASSWSSTSRTSAGSAWRSATTARSPRRRASWRGSAPR